MRFVGPPSAPLQLSGGLSCCCRGRGWGSEPNSPSLPHHLSSLLEVPECFNSSTLSDGCQVMDASLVAWLGLQGSTSVVQCIQPGWGVLQGSFHECSLGVHSSSSCSQPATCLGVQPPLQPVQNIAVVQVPCSTAWVVGCGWRSPCSQVCGQQLLRSQG